MWTNQAIGYRVQLSLLRSGIDNSGNPLWLDPYSSHFLFESAIVLHTDGAIKAGLVYCTAHLVPGRWPASKPYPQPIMRDLHGVATSFQPLIKKDIRDFAANRGFKRTLLILDAFEAIDRFTSEPSLENAVLIYDNILKGIDVEMMSGTDILGNILADFYPRINASEAILALQEYLLLITLLDRAKPSAQQSPNAINQIQHVIDSAPVNTPQENRAAFDRLLRDLNNPANPLAAYTPGIPRKVFENLTRALTIFHTPPNPKTFALLERHLFEFFERNILPQYVEAVIAESSGSSLPPDAPPPPDKSPESGEHVVHTSRKRPRDG